MRGEIFPIRRLRWCRQCNRPVERQHNYAQMLPRWRASLVHSAEMQIPVHAIRYGYNGCCVRDSRGRFGFMPPRSAFHRK